MYVYHRQGANITRNIHGMHATRPAIYGTPLYDRGVNEVQQHLNERVLRLMTLVSSADHQSGKSNQINQRYGMHDGWNYLTNSDI